MDTYNFQLCMVLWRHFLLTSADRWKCWCHQRHLLKQSPILGKMIFFDDFFANFSISCSSFQWYITRGCLKLFSKTRFFRRPLQQNLFSSQNVAYKILGLTKSVDTPIISRLNVIYGLSQFDPLPAPNGDKVKSDVTIF